MSVYWMTELFIQKLEHYPNSIDVIWSIHMTANDKIGQTLAKFDNVIENILKVGYIMILLQMKKISSCNVSTNKTPNY